MYVYVYIVPKVGAKDKECLYAPVVAPKQSFALSNLLPGLTGQWWQMFHMAIGRFPKSWGTPKSSILVDRMFLCCFH